MTNAAKVLGQLNPAPTTLADLYVVPGGKQCVSSSIVVCNRAGGAQTFRISVAVAGAANNVKQYLYYDLPLTGNNTFIATIGITLGSGDVVRVYASNGNLSFNLFGTEIT